MLDFVFKEELLKKGFLVIDRHISSKDKCDNSQVAALLKSFESLGYTLSIQGVKRISELSTNGLKKFYKNSYDLLLEFSGAAFNHRVFYKNFPNISNIPLEEKYIRAILHYLTVDVDDYGFMNQDLKEDKRIEFHSDKKETLNVINEKEAIEILTIITKNRFEGKKAISYSEQVFLKMFLHSYKDLLTIEDIPFKENIGVYFACLPYNEKTVNDIIDEKILSFIKTPTDLLRVYAALSNGDVTLRDNFKFISLNRKNRRLFLSILDKMAESNNAFNDDLKRHEFLWKRAFEMLHPGEYAKKYKYIYEASSLLRNEEYQNFYSKLEEVKTNQKEYLSLLMSRPGEFARRLDLIIRNEKFDLNYTLVCFEKIITKVSTNVLLSIWEHFNNRNLYPKRIIKINTSTKSLYKEVEDTRPLINKEVIDKIINLIEEGLVNIYSNYENKGKVYLDEKIKQFALVKNDRNASSQNKTLTYGTRVKLDESEFDYLRFFTHFKNIDKVSMKGEKYQERVDVDISFEFLNDNVEYEFSIAWYDMSNSDKMNSYHSGDITTAPEGASEFIDLEYRKARKFGRYVVISNTVYTGQNFCDIPECFSGLMFVKEMAKEGEIFNPEFVEHKYSLTQKGANMEIAFVLDLETMELIWVDAPISKTCPGVVASEYDGMCICVKDVLKKHMNLYEFMLLHKGHCTFVDSKDEADIIVSLDDDATFKPYDIEKIAKEWL